jgi:hypothetical protein
MLAAVLAWLRRASTEIEVGRTSRIERPLSGSKGLAGDWSGHGSEHGDGDRRRALTASPPRAARSRDALPGTHFEMV